MAVFFDILHRSWNYIPDSILSGGGGGGGSSLPVDNNVDVFTPTNGQTVFNLSSAITIAANKTKLFVNGVKMPYGINYTIVGNVLTFIPTNFVLKNTDKLEVYYG